LLVCETVGMDTDADARPAVDPREKRAKTMITLGAVAFIWGFLALIAGGNPAAFALVLLGVGLLVAGLVTRR
jgi:hypothetical protein